MEIKGQLKFIRTSPRKARIIANLVKGMNVVVAENQLHFANKVAARIISKLLDSTVANAINNFKLKKEDLYIKKITVDGGPSLKRWMPRAMGRATPILKRSSHIMIVLDERPSSASSSRETIKEHGKVDKAKKVKETKKATVTDASKLWRRSEGKEKKTKK
jgi:large subunit ribosomal protein L22